MPRRAKIVLVAVVLVAGLLVAWQFRKPSAATAVEKSTADGPARTALDQSPASQPPNTAPPLDLATAPAQQTAPSTDASPPPHVEPAPAQAQSSDNSADATPDHTAAVALKPAETAVPELPQNFSGVDRSNRAAPLELRSEPVADDPTAPTHKIVDGDSLSSLAERYLGSAARAGEIFACNRDVLSDPELLPIGVRLRIPAGPARPKVAATPPAGSTSDFAPPAASPAAANPLRSSPAPQTQIASETAKAPPLLDIGARRCRRCRRSGPNRLPPSGFISCNPATRWRVFPKSSTATVGGPARFCKPIAANSARSKTCGAG